MNFSFYSFKGIAVLTGAIAILGAAPAGAGQDKITQDSDSLAPLPQFSMQKFLQTDDRKLAELSAQLGRSIDKVHKSLEEWGTLTLSGLVLAPPNGTFAIDINNPERESGKKFDFDHWFTEASKGEGSVEFTERIFNSLAASGTLQLAPEQAAIAQTFFAKQKIEEQLFRDQLERNQVQRAAELDDFQQNRVNAAQGRRVNIDGAQAAVDRAKTARVEAEVTRNGAANRRSAALAEMNKAQADLNAATPADRAAKLKTLQEKQAAYDKANADFRTMDDNLRSRVAEEKTAGIALADAKGAKVTTGLLPGATVTEVNRSPTFGKTEFVFEAEASPGESFTQAKSFASSFPAPTPSPFPPSTIPPTLGSVVDPTTKAPHIESAFPARARLIDAAGNQVISRIFDFLGDPSAASQFEDKPILMAVATMAVNPGWRTGHDYDGQIDAEVIYKWGPARRTTCERLSKFTAEDSAFTKAEIEVATHFAANGLWPEASSYGRKEYTALRDNLLISRNRPLAAAVSPLMERQNIDEASSRARQDEIALFLSASLAKSGQKAAGEVFNKYMKMRRLDVKTLSSLPVVNSYGMGGGRFGFHVTSRIQAVGNLNKPKAEDVLEKQNFPVLIVFGLSSEDLRPRLVQNGARAEIWEPHIMLTQNHQWSRQKKLGVFHQGLRSVFLPGYPGRPAETPVDSYRLLLEAERAKENFDVYLRSTTLKEKNFHVAFFAESSAEDYDLLKQAYFTTEAHLDIPVDTLAGFAPAPKKTAPDRAFITSVEPNVLTPRAVPGATANSTIYEAEVILLGSHLDMLDAKTAIAGQNISVVPVALPPGIPPEQAMALKLTFAARPVDAVQVAMPQGKPQKGFQPMVYSPLISFQY